MKGRQIWLAAAAVLLVAMPVTACTPGHAHHVQAAPVTGANATPGSHVSVAGHLMVAGGPIPGARPLAGRILETTLCTGLGEDCRAPMPLTSTAADGSFSAWLPPGTYELIGQSPQIGGGISRCGPVQVRVDPGEITQTTIFCQVR